MPAYRSQLDHPPPRTGDQMVRLWNASSSRCRRQEGYCEASGGGEGSFESTNATEAARVASVLPSHSDRQQACQPHVRTASRAEHRHTHTHMSPLLALPPALPPTQCSLLTTADCHNEEDSRHDHVTSSSAIPRRAALQARYQSALHTPARTVKPRSCVTHSTLWGVFTDAAVPPPVHLLREEGGGGNCTPVSVSALRRAVVSRSPQAHLCFGGSYCLAFF